MSTNTPNHTGLRIRDFARLPSSSPHEDRTIKEEPNQEPVWDENSNPLENIPSLGLELLKFKDYLPSSPQIGSIWPCSTFSGSSDRLEDFEEESRHKRMERKRIGQSPTIKEMQSKMLRTECELEVLKEENESLKKSNEMEHRGDPRGISPGGTPGKIVFLIPPFPGENFPIPRGKLNKKLPEKVIFFYVISLFFTFCYIFGHL